MEPDTSSEHAEADAQFKAIYDGAAPWSAARGAVDRKLSALYADLRPDPAARDAFERLRWNPALIPLLARPGPVLAALGPRPGNTLFDALALLAARHAHWVRAPEEWPGAVVGDASSALAGLSRHLLASWPVPSFLDTAWVAGRTPDGRVWRDLCVAVAEGRSLRNCPFPAPMTERARHHFLQAPEEMGLVAALRWGQVRGMGGDARLAWALVGTRLEAIQPDEPFWESVLRFLADRPAFPRAQVGPLCDFLAARREAEPDLSMKGRTTDALLRQMDAWHEALATASRGKQRRWEPMGLTPFERIEKDLSGGATLTWSVEELSDTRALQEEGSALRHCVRSYAGDCVQGIKAVFSLRLRASDTRVTRPILTIEVNREKRSVVQVRGKANCLPKEQSPHSRVRRGGEVVRIWARERHLGIAAHF